MSDNVFHMSSYGKPIALDDQGVYFAINRSTGAINNVFHLVYEDDWYLYQLKNTGKHGEMGWVILADNGDYPLQSVSTEDIRHYFDKPEYAEPAGAWQVIRNSRYGFGKFTPQHADAPLSFAMILFSGPDMLVPLLIKKAEDEVLHGLAALEK